MAVCVTCVFLWPPQMWACALGHTEAALVLYQWDPRALAIPDSLGRLPLNIARSRGHTRLAELLEQLQQTPQAQGQPADTWMDRWRGESQLSGISSSPTPNSNSGGKDTIVLGGVQESVYPKHKCLLLVVCNQSGGFHFICVGFDISTAELISEL